MSFLWTLHWHHNGCDGVSNHQPRDYLLNRLFRRRLKKHQSSTSLALCVESTGGLLIPRTKGQQRGKCFHWMTSSWILMKRSDKRTPKHARKTRSNLTPFQALCCTFPEPLWKEHCNRGQIYPLRFSKMIKVAYVTETRFVNISRKRNSASKQADA